MKKINCYSRYASYVYLIILIVSIIVGVLPFVLFKENESGIFKIVWIFIIAFCLSISIFGFFHHRQYLSVEDEKIVLRNSFCKMKELDINNCYYEVCKLPGYYGRIYLDESWICIYESGETRKFKHGFSNSKRYLRIQLICNENSLKFINAILSRGNNCD